VATGAWRWDALNGYQGAGWLADTAVQGQVSKLTFERTIDLRFALAPQLSFWQQGTLGRVTQC